MHRVGLFLLLFPIASYAADEDPCFAADALLDAGMLEQATAAYLEILNRPVDSAEGGDPADANAATGNAEADQLVEKQCALKALPNLRDAAIRQKLDKAQVYEDRKDYDSAATAINEALDIDADSVDVQLALNDLLRKSKPKDDPIKRARSLADFGLFTEARDVLTEAIKTASESSNVVLDIPEDLQYLSGGKVDSWRNAKRWISTWGVPILEFAGVAIALIVLVRLIIKARGRKPDLRIGEINSGGFEATHLGPYFANNLLNRMESHVSKPDVGHIGLVSGPIEPISVPSDITAAIPEGPTQWLSPVTWAKAIPAVIDWLFPRRTLVLTGELHNLGKRGLGVTVRLTENDQVLVARAFWDKEFDYKRNASERDEEEKLYQIADYVAIWLLFETNSRFGKRQTLLGTADWRSYAYFRAGCHAENNGRNIAARHLYRRALDRSPSFRGARVNLGRLLTENKAELDSAIRELEQVKHEAENDPRAYNDPTLYSALYFLAATKANRGETVVAADGARALLNFIDDTADCIKEKKPGYNSPRLSEHLDSIRPAVNTMLGALLVMNSNPPGNDEQKQTDDTEGRNIIDEEADLSSPSSLHQYNLACSYAELANIDHAGGAPMDVIKKHIESSLAHLRRSLQISTKPLRQARSSNMFRTVKQFASDRFEALLHEYEGETEEAPEESLPLAEYTIIGSDHASALAQQEIRNQDELLAKATLATDRKKLADLVTVSARMIKAWAQSVDLDRIPGIDPSQVNLLRLANVTSINNLLKKSAQELAEDLAALALATGGDAPTADDIRRWKDHATTNTKPIIT